MLVEPSGKAEPSRPIFAQQNGTCDWLDSLRPPWHLRASRKMAHTAPKALANFGTAHIHLPRSCVPHPRPSARDGRTQDTYLRRAQCDDAAACGYRGAPTGTAGRRRAMGVEQTGTCIWPGSLRPPRQRHHVWTSVATLLHARAEAHPPVHQGVANFGTAHQTQPRPAPWDRPGGRGGGPGRWATPEHDLHRPLYRSPSARSTTARDPAPDPAVRARTEGAGWAGRVVLAARLRASA